MCCGNGSCLSPSRSMHICLCPRRWAMAAMWCR
ncbi:hypothetical protein [uncultured Ruminococcus sp.]